MKKLISCTMIAAMFLSILSFGSMSVSAESYWNGDIKFTAAHGTVTIDGKADAGEWDDTEAISIKLNGDALADRGHVNYQGEWEGSRDDSDYQGTYKIKWDENNIYFFEERIDDHINLSATASEPWTTDGALIFTQVPDSPATVNPDGISHHIFYTVGKDGQVGGDVMLRLCNMLDGTRDTIPAEGAVIASALTDKGYIVEIAVPWSMYTADVPNFKAPKANDIMGLSYVIHDSDTDDAGFVKQLCYAIDNDMTGEVPGGYDFGGWGVVELLAPVVVETPAEAPAEEAAPEAPAVEEVNAPAAEVAPVAATPAPVAPATGNYTPIILAVLIVGAAVAFRKFAKSRQ